MKLVHFPKTMLSKQILRISKTVLVRQFATETKGFRTALYDFHLDNGGKIVNFGGFLLPVQYKDQGIAESHLYTRKNASLFDVSHMLQTEITGPGCIQFLEQLCTADLEALKENQSVLTIFTNDSGGILDDLIVTKINKDHLFVVSNAGRKEHDIQLLINALNTYRQQNNLKVDIRFFDPLERSLLALQGPKSSDVLQQLTDVNLSELYFMHSANTTLAGVQGCRITRCGYTGEDGFEISFPAMKSIDVANAILKSGITKLAGLGARDSLRLEAGLCLYGNDITEDTSPVEAGLTWLISKGRREKRNFPGAKVILDQIQNGISRKRVGVMSSSGPPARHGAPVYDETGKAQVGTITSGCPGPSVNSNVAMGYVNVQHSKIGTLLQYKIREKLYNCSVAKMPCIKANYYNKPK